MPKDAKGHGSNPRGGSAAHQSGVGRVGLPVGPVNPKVLDVIAKNPNGASITLAGQQPTSGHMVALQGRSLNVDAADLKGPKGVKILNDFVQKNSDVYGNPAMHIGTWYDPDTKKVVVDPSENIKNRAIAMSMGRQRNQKEIWDVKNKVGIKTGGTGT